jgi:hypothetical protein
MATVRVWIVILTVQITLSVCLSVQSYGTYCEQPELIDAVPRLLGDVTAMLFLAEGDLPRKVQVRPASSARVFVGLGDAAKAGYGMAVVDVLGESHFLNSSMELTTQPGDTLMLKGGGTVLLTEESPAVHAEYGHWTEVFGNNSSNH